MTVTIIPVRPYGLRPGAGATVKHAHISMPKTKPIMGPKSYIWQVGFGAVCFLLYYFQFSVFYGCREHLRLHRRPVGTDYAGTSGLGTPLCSL